jgi:hypothetical protein
MTEETQIREQAKQLGIPNYWNKNIIALKQEVLNKQSGVDEIVEEELEEVNETPPVGTGIGTDELEKLREENKQLKKNVAKKHDTMAKSFEKSVEAEQTEGNKGFIEAAKEESLYAFPNEKGDRIGLWRRTTTETDIKPYQKDSSYAFVRWSDEKVGTVHKGDVTISREEWDRTQKELAQLKK